MPGPRQAPEPPAPASPRRAAIWLTGAILLAVAAWGAWAFLGQPARPEHRPEYAKVRRGTFDVRLRIAGTTQASMFQVVPAPKLRSLDSGRALTLLSLAATGSRVRMGDVVAEFDPRSARDHRDETADDVRNRENALLRLRANLDIALEAQYQAVAKARARLDKARLDMKTAIVRSGIQKAKFELEAEEAEVALAAAETQLGLTFASQSSSMRISEINRDLEKIRLDRETRDMERLALRAPFDGMVVVKDTHRPDGSRVALAKGDDIRPGQPVLHVVDPGSMEVVAQVNQTEVMRFKPGQEAAISLDGFPGAGYRGTVVSIGWLAQPPGRQQFSVRTVPVRIRLHDADDRVLPDLSAAADVLVERLDNALIVPASAVRQEAGKPYVVIANGSGEEKRDVTVGPVQGNETAILDGLAEGEILLLPVSGLGSSQ